MQSAIVPDKDISSFEVRNHGLLEQLGHRRDATLQVDIHRAARRLRVVEALGNLLVPVVAACDHDLGAQQRHGIKQRNERSRFGGRGKVRTLPPLAGLVAIRFTRPCT